MTDDNGQEVLILPRLKKKTSKIKRVNFCCHVGAFQLVFGVDNIKRMSSFS